MEKKIITIGVQYRRKRNKFFIFKKKKIIILNELLYSQFDFKLHLDFISS